MATLLHVDSSMFPRGVSSSRAVTEQLRGAWQDRHPGGTVCYRDLDADPVPHLGADGYDAGFLRPADRSPGQAAAFAVRIALIEELERADAVLIGAPMYNFAIPSTLKAWLDNVILVGRTAATASPSLTGTPVTVVASRGGSYPAGLDHVRGYLTLILADTLGMKLDFVLAGRTNAHLIRSATGRAEVGIDVI